MAIPGAPQNVYLQTGNAKNFLSWDISAGATSYNVNRSTDGVTFTLLASPTVNSYLDSSVTVGTQYFYKVASVNADGTSGYTNSDPKSAVPSLAGQMSLGEIRLRAQQRSDRVNSKFVKLPEWNFFINQAYYELYDLLITTYEDYYVAPRLSIVTTGSQLYPLPDGQNNSGAPALYKLYGVDLGLNSSTNAFVTLKKFDFISRNRYIFPQITSNVLAYFNLEYRLIGGNIMIIPTPAAGQTFGLWYFPRLTTLLQDTDIMDGISGWTEYVIIRAAKYALDKEESDTSKLDEEIIFLKSRIEESAQNRDAGQPDTVSNTAGANNHWWGSAGYPDGGSYGGY